MTLFKGKKLMDLTNAENTKLEITPKILLAIIVVILGAYGWIYASFTTKVEASEIVSRLDDHITDTHLYRIDLEIRNLLDKQWQLQEYMRMENGDTAERRQKDREFTVRIQKKEKQRLCITRGNNHCFPDRQ
jgi:hypothetical protein